MLKEWNLSSKLSKNGDKTNIFYSGNTRMKAINFIEEKNLHATKLRIFQLKRYKSIFHCMHACDSRQEIDNLFKLSVPLHINFM